MHKSDKKILIGDLARNKYPNSVPIIVYYNKTLIQPPTKFHTKTENLLINKDASINNLIINIRQKIKINYTDTIVISINNDNIDSDTNIFELYEKYKSGTDGCLHIDVTVETTISKNKN